MRVGDAAIDPAGPRDELEGDTPRFRQIAQNGGDGNTAHCRLPVAGCRLNRRMTAVDWGIGLGRRRSGLATRRSGLATRRSGLATRRSGLATRRSGLATRRSAIDNSIVNLQSTM